MKKQLYKTVFLTMVTIIFVAIFVGVVFFISGNYYTFSGSPKIEKGVLDFSKINSNVGESTVKCLQGEWEFFYNDWIVTDNVNRQNDGYITIPGSWEGRTINGKKLSREGYASYRIVLKNATLSQVCRLADDKCMGAYRTFVNGVLQTQYGFPSKEKGKSKLTDIYEYNFWQFSGDTPQDIELVVELGYNNFGGFNVALALMFQTDLDNPRNFADTYNFKAHDRMGVTFLIIMVVILMFSTTILFALKYKKWVWHFLFFASCCLCLLFSKECEGLIKVLLNVEWYNAYYLVFIKFAMYMLAFGLWLTVMVKENCIVINKIELVVMSVYCLLMFLIYYYSFGTRFRYFPPFLVDIALIYWVVKICYFANIKNRLGILYLLSINVLILMFNLSMFDYAGAFHFTMQGIEMVVFGVFSVLFCATTLYIINKIYKLALAYSQKSEELQNTKYEFNHYQVSSKLINSSLDAILKGYAINNATGDDVLIKFSKYLRTNIDASSTQVENFDTAISNAENYFDLENIIRGNILKLNLRIYANNYSLPELIFQPFIEQILQQLENDGYLFKTITLSSCVAKENFRITFNYSATNGNTEDFFGNTKIQNAINILNIIYDTKMTTNKSKNKIKIILDLSKKENNNESNFN